MARTSITIVLELDETVDVPVGQAHLPDGTVRTFHGWLGFGDVIASVIDGGARRDATSPGTAPGTAEPTPGR